MSKTGQQITSYFSIGANSAGYPTLQPGQVYYLNVMNRVGGVEQCGTQCNVAIEWGGTRTYTVNGQTSAVGTTVVLRNANDPSVQLGPVTSDANGKFKFNGVTGGDWIVEATKAGFTQSGGQPPIYIDGDRTLPIQMDPDGATKRPVLLVPGVMGSTLSQGGITNYKTQVPRDASERVVGQAPKLPPERCDLPPATCPLRHYLDVYDPTRTFGDQGDYTAMGSSYLIKALEGAGYRVFRAPWDWREPLDRAYQIYLKRWIDDAKRKTGFAKVDIVAHSMGGLLARKYIQSAEYQDDVGRLIMLGTPNGGSTNAYYLMHGGDPIELDKVTTPYWSGAGFWAEVAIYSGAVNELWRSYNNGDDIISTTWFDGDVDRDSGYIGSNTKAKAKIREFLNTNVPGGNDLLPTYDFLRKWSSTWGNLDSTDFKAGILQSSAGLNSGLAALNAGPNLDRFVTINAAGSYQVGTQLISLATKTQERHVAGAWIYKARYRHLSERNTQLYRTEAGGGRHRIDGDGEVHFCRESCRGGLWHAPSDGG